MLHGRGGTAASIKHKTRGMFDHDHLCRRSGCGYRIRQPDAEPRRAAARSAT